MLQPQPLYDQVRSLTNWTLAQLCGQSDLETIAVVRRAFVDFVVKAEADKPCLLAIWLEAWMCFKNSNAYPLRGC